MISEWGMNLGLSLLDIIWSLLGVLPSFSQNVTSAIDTFFDFIFSSMGLVSIFVDVNMIKILIPLVIAVLNFDKIIKLVMFILKKIPIAGIK